MVAFNYGARQEIARAARRIAAEVAAGRARSADDRPPTCSARYLDAPDIARSRSHHPHQRRAAAVNFLLWQAAYSEFVFVPTYWPDFDRAALEERDRRISPARAPFRRPGRADRIVIMANAQAEDAAGLPTQSRGRSAISCCALSRRLVLAPLAVGAAYLGGWPFVVFWGSRRSACCGNGRRSCRPRSTSAR